MNSLVKKIIIRSASFTLVCVGILLIVFKNSKASVLGFLFGYLMSVICFFHMKISTERAIKMRPDAANAYIRRMYGVRLLLYAAVLIGSIYSPDLNPLASFLGLIVIKYTIVLSAAIDSDFLTDNKEKGGYFGS